MLFGHYCYLYWKKSEESGKQGGNIKGNYFRLPVHDLAGLQPEVFAAYTGPEGGLTCISR